MVDSISFSYRISDKIKNKLKNNFDEQIIKSKRMIKDNETGESKSLYEVFDLPEKKDITYVKYFKNESFNYTLVDSNDLVPFPTLKITGSIPKQLKGDNIRNYIYNKNDVSYFYEIINSEVNTELSDNDLTYISRCDIGVNIPNVPTTTIINSLKNISPSRMDVHLFDYSIRFGNKTRSLRIYDKVKEALEKEKDIKIKNTLSGKIVSRIESQLVRNRNIDKFDIRTVADVMDFKKQKALFYDTYSKIIKTNKIRDLCKLDNDLKLNEVSKIMEIENAISKFGNLESYRKYLLNEGFKPSAVSQHISKLRGLEQYAQKDVILSIDEKIKDELDKLEKK